MNAALTCRRRRPRANCCGVGIMLRASPPDGLDIEDSWLLRLLTTPPGSGVTLPSSPRRLNAVRVRSTALHAMYRKWSRSVGAEDQPAVRSVARSPHYTRSTRQMTD